MEAVAGFPTVVANIEGDSKLLFIVLLLGIISWKGVSSFNEGVSFSDGGTSFLNGGMVTPEGALVLVGVFRKTHKMVGDPMPTMPPPPPDYGKPSQAKDFLRVKISITSCK